MPEIFGAALMGGGSGRAYAAIGAIYPAGATCTCSYGGKTIAAKDTSGRALFLVPSAGQWLVKATNGGREVEDTVSITTQGQVVSVTLAFFSATIAVTFPTDCTSVTCTKGDTVLSVPSGSLSSGSYTFNIPETGEWVLYATNGTKEKTINVNVEGETEYTASLAFRQYIFKAGENISSGFTFNNDRASKITNALITQNTATDHSNDSGFYISPSIDLTDYSTLVFDIKVQKYTGNVSPDPKIMYGCGKNSDVSRVSASLFSAYSNSMPSNRTEILIDISSISTSCYIKSVSYDSTALIYNIWLE